jgi:hypothetical protein
MPALLPRLRPPLAASVTRGGSAGEEGLPEGFSVFKKAGPQDNIRSSLAMQVIGRHILHELLTAWIFALQNMLVIGRDVLIEVLTACVLA